MEADANAFWVDFLSVWTYRRFENCGVLSVSSAELRLVATTGLRKAAFCPLAQTKALCAKHHTPLLPAVLKVSRLEARFHGTPIRIDSLCSFWTAQPKESICNSGEGVDAFSQQKDAQFCCFLYRFGLFCTFQGGENMMRARIHVLPHDSGRTRHRIRIQHNVLSSGKAKFRHSPDLVQYNTVSVLC